MASALDGFVRAVIEYTLSASWRKLADHLREAIHDVLEQNLVHMDSLLETLTADRYSMSVVPILYVKMNQPYTDAVKEGFENTLSQVESMIPFFDSVQISFIPDIYVLLFRKIYEYCLLQIKKPSRGIMLLSNAISILVKEETEMITSLHPCLFCLCLKARIHDPAFPFLHLAISKILKETSSRTGPYMDPKWVLLYFYYGGLLYAVVGRYREAFAMMQKVCYVPAVACSAIMLDAYKKYVLFSLLLHEKTVPLSNYRSSVIDRDIIPMCEDYSALQKICECEEEDFDKASGILKYLEAHLAVFERDKNVGLVKLVVRRIRENSMKRLSKCFMTISLSDVVRRCHLDDTDHAERYLIDMNKKGEISARIDKEKGFVYFEDIKEEAEERKADEAAERLYKLNELMKQCQELITVDPTYIANTAQGSSTVEVTTSFPEENIIYQVGPPSMHQTNVDDTESAGGTSTDKMD